MKVIGELEFILMLISQGYAYFSFSDISGKADICLTSYDGSYNEEGRYRLVNVEEIINLQNLFMHTSSNSRYLNVILTLLPAGKFPILIFITSRSSELISA